MAITYRSFRNSDPPSLVQIWNESIHGRGAAFLPGTFPFEHYVLAKPYFDPHGLIVAEDNGLIVGFCHAGFGPDETRQRLNYDTGVVCAIMVRPTHRQKGVASELLRKAEAYLRGKGATTIYCGAMRPFTPFYWGLYGGPELPGVLASERTMAAFLAAQQYVPGDGSVILIRQLEIHTNIGDHRFAQLRRRFEIEVGPRSTRPRWYEECVLAPFESTQFRVIEKATGRQVASALTWEMDLFAWRSHEPNVGLIDLEVDPAYRRQGLGKFFLAKMLQDFGELCYASMEVQVRNDNSAALKLLDALNFETIDEGRVYRLVRGE